MGTFSASDRESTGLANPHPPTSAADTEEKTKKIVPDLRMRRLSFDSDRSPVCRGGQCSRVHPRSDLRIIIQTCSQFFEPPDKTFLLRFWKKVNRNDNDGCWVWTGSCKRSGYGEISVRRGFYDHVRRSAHRISWELHNGPIPTDRWVLHHCDNPPCVNPGHLYLGDHAQNTADMVNRNRASRNARKLTDEQVIEIRALRACGWSQRRIRERYGVSLSIVSNAVRGETYSYLPGAIESWSFRARNHA